MSAVRTSVSSESVSTSTFPIRKACLYHLQTICSSKAQHSQVFECNPMQHKRNNKRAYALPLLKAENKVKAEISTTMCYSHTEQYVQCYSVEYSREKTNIVSMQFCFVFKKILASRNAETVFSSYILLNAIFSITENLNI